MTRAFARLDRSDAALLAGAALYAAGALRRLLPALAIDGWRFHALPESLTP